MWSAECGSQLQVPCGDLGLVFLGEGRGGEELLTRARHDLHLLAVLDPERHGGQLVE
jgi:hypothetical protein